jgi:glycosyltransferase involved in cell wall biosynthesis
MISIIIPAKNEAPALASLLPELKKAYADAEIIVVNDGSTDETKKIVENCGVTLVSHPYSVGNGASIKSGTRAASGNILIFLDGDGQHQVSEISKLLSKYNEGYDMVVGARDKASQANLLRWAGNSFYNVLASHLVGHTISDLTSGFRVVNAKKFKEFLYLYPNGFSAPTTVTMAFFRSGYTVYYEPIHVKKRVGQSHLLPFRDGLRFLLIIYKITTLYSPLKVFLPFAVLHFFLGIINYIYTYSSQGRFTNMSAVLFSSSVIIFLIGLLCEQITTLMYSASTNEDH